MCDQATRTALDVSLSISVYRILPCFNLHPCRCTTFHTKRQRYFITFDRIKVGICFFFSFFLFYFIFFYSFRSYYHPLSLPRNLNKLVKRSYSTLPFLTSFPRIFLSTLYTLSVWQFSILFSIHVLRCWRGEFVSQSRASLVAYHFLFLVYDSGVIL